MKLADLKIDNKIFGSKMLLISVEEAAEYLEGKKTGRVDGYKYTVVLPEMNYEKLTVKIAGDKKLDADGRTPDVKFEDLVCTAYVMDRSVGIKATAKNITSVK